ncbi:FAD-binding oxidoreductase [Undibacterium umbellatum]|uniref:FAD-binding oxidoreductase n=1 Tax=Undibacterium umbellatum TaxID=2762300 RepID=A0ABR6Z4N1_9BURK|nr:FAD-binding oxidoreductase [Undibacterium umbellatum]MBC3906504.1 FAD-binding oxidoreductase [Undibacterium umbellatum]
MQTEFLASCISILGNDFVITKEADQYPYLIDWRQRYRGKALAVLLPQTTAEVSSLVQLCALHQVACVPQGGNTGLVLGSVPDQSGQAVVISLKRMNRVLAIDVANNTVTVQAGCLLAQVQAAAIEQHRLLPLSLASEGSCTIGGNLSTNAGGTAVLRYGNTRELCLGLEVVTAQGEIWDGLRGLRKDNTGYDLRDLFIGAEGTLGIITAAVLKLFPQPRAQITAFTALENPDAALGLLKHSQYALGPTLTAFELISDFSLQLVLKHFPQLQHPFGRSYPYYALLEMSDHESESHAIALIEQVLEQAMNDGHATDAVCATSISQSRSLWKLREHISEAQAKEGKNIKHDIAIPVSQIPRFIQVTDTELKRAFPGCQIVCFGHMGDGNLHYNVSAPVGCSDTDFILQQTSINRIVHDHAHQLKGSISAEHGLGMLKRDEIKLYKSDLELSMMRAIKVALDPQNLMNPGKVL